MRYITRRINALLRGAPVGPDTFARVSDGRVKICLRREKFIGVDKDYVSLEISTTKPTSFRDVTVVARDLRTKEVYGNGKLWSPAPSWPEWWCVLYSVPHGSSVVVRLSETKSSHGGQRWEMAR